MATLSLPMRDDLKATVQPLASEQGFSLISYINAALAATIAQAVQLAMMGNRISNVDVATQKAEWPYLQRDWGANPSILRDLSMA